VQADIAPVSGDPNTRGGLDAHPRVERRRPLSLVRLHDRRTHRPMVVVPGLGAIDGGDVSIEELRERLGPPTPVPRLGEALVERGLVSAEAFEAVLAESQRTGALTGELLVARGTVRRLDLYRTLSDLWGIPFCDLKHTEPDIELVPRFGLDPATLARKPWIPIGEAQGVLLVATCERPTDRLARDVRTACNWTGAVVFHATTEWDLRAAVLRAHGAELTRRAASDLAERVPEESASRVLTRPQAVVLAGTGVALLALLVLSGQTTLVMLFLLFNVFYAGNVGFKVAAIAAGVIRLRGRAVRGTPEPPAISDRDLPMYTILVPAFGEANVIADLIGHLSAVDYPADRLEVILLLEEVDRETIDAALHAGLPGFVRIVVVPDGQPRTKPKACNVGLQFARGQFLVIFDAEDRPDPDQLRRAAAAFAAAGPDLVCLQARLNYHNASENLLTRFFTLEYSHWFDLMLEGLVALRLPIPLGGTSNHFRTDALRELGGWDSHNVTEDADLGLRAAARGYVVRTLASTTYEEACCRTWPWIRQRTRWIKGYLQTGLVHTRHPIRFVRAAGPHATLTLFLLILATPLAFLASPILWAYFAYTSLGIGPGLAVDDSLARLALANLVVGNVLMIGVSGAAALGRRNFALIPFMVLLPLYWVLHSIAAWRALYQLITAPSYWEKTPHGLSAHAAPNADAARALAAEAAARLQAELELEVA
jgi:hypothetical protein